MTIEVAKEVIREELSAIRKAPEKATPFVAALEMAGQAMDIWERNLDIEYDYNAQAKQLREMTLHFGTEDKPSRKDGCYVCPACGRPIQEWHHFCHDCGKRLGWGKNTGRNRKEEKRKWKNT